MNYVSRAGGKTIGRPEHHHPVTKHAGRRRPSIRPATITSAIRKGKWTWKTPSR
jgi:hypothetical protein